MKIHLLLVFFQSFWNKLQNEEFNMLSEAEKLQEFGNLTEKGLNQWIQSIVSAVNDHNYDGNVRGK